MDDMREIGYTLQAEQNLTADGIIWLTTIAQTILRAFVWDEGQPMRTLATCPGDFATNSLHDAAFGHTSLDLGS